MKQQLINGMPVDAILDKEYFRENNVLNLLPAAVYVCDLSGQIINYNKKAVELWGRTPGKGDNDERFCGAFKLYYPDGKYMPHSESPVAACLVDGLPRKDVVMIERPDLSRIIIKVNIAPIKNDEGNLLGMVNCFYDITEQKQLYHSLKESDLRYGKLIQSLNTPLYTTDAEGRITLYNKAAADLWGREPEIGKDLWCGSYRIFRTDGTYLPLEKCPMAVCLKEQRPVNGEEILVERPDGTLRNVAPFPQPIFDSSGKMTGAINMLVDITDVKQTERALRLSEEKYREISASLEKKVREKVFDLRKKNEELRKSEERYHKMVDEVEDYAIILLSKDGIIENWNKGAEKIKGYTEEEIIGKSFEVFYPAEDRKIGLPKRIIGEATKNGKAIAEGWRIRKDGSKFWGSIVITALHDESNNIIGFTKVTRDLTQKKIAEDKLKEFSSELEFQNKELEQFAYAASHDLKEPLRKIHLYNSYISSNLSNKLDDKSREYLNRSISSVNRMMNLIEDLLTYSKNTASIESLTKVNLNEIIIELISEHNDELKQKNIKIYAQDLPTIRAIPYQCEQLMNNLINNSIKYKHPDREGIISIRSELVKGSEIKRSKALPGKYYYRISFIDNGVGFKEEYAEKIFEVFQRLNHVPGTRGSGVGLAICKKIVQNHRGFIEAIGKPGEGARFNIFFPL